MAFKEKLAEKLKDKLPGDELKLLPNGFQRLDTLIILNLREELIAKKKAIGEAVLDLFPGVKTVCAKVGGIKGDFREPQIETIAGSEDTEVEVVEHGCKWKFDANKIMFAKGNQSERQRVPRLVKSGEIIVDMFAGIGYFSLGLAKFSKAKKVYSIELNPVAFKYLKENIKLNKISNIEAIHGDCRMVVDDLLLKGIKTDRIIMGYLPPPVDFLPWAFKIIKSDGMIHYEDILVEDKLEEEKERVMALIKKEAIEKGFNVRLEHLQRVKGYRPKVGHYVFDVRVI